MEERESLLPLRRRNAATKQAAIAARISASSPEEREMERVNSAIVPKMIIDTDRPARAPRVLLFMFVFPLRVD